MIKLYDLLDDYGIFLMRAPLRVISRYLCLHPDAEKRIVKETEAGRPCEIWKHNDMYRVLPALYKLDIQIKVPEEVM